MENPVTSKTVVTGLVYNLGIERIKNMAKKSEVTQGQGLVEKVGYNPHNLTSLICVGTSGEILGSKFVVVIQDGELSQYDNTRQELVGKTVTFNYQGVSDINVPLKRVFVSVE